MIKPTFYFSFFLLILFTSCNNKNNVEQAQNSINSADLEKHVKVLASDDFQGRKPCTSGEQKTTNYIADAFKNMGIPGAYNGNYFQKVPLVKMIYEPQEKVAIKTKKGVVNLEYISDFIAKTPRIEENVVIKKSDLVFAGYGIVAPEYGWNDYKDIDVKGKTVLVLVNDPGFTTQDNKLFNGNAMTYYGRWAYKYEEAARQGAAGILVIHNTAAAGYGWKVLTNTARTNLFIQKENKNADRCALEGWMTEAAAEKLFAACGKQFDK